MRGLVVVPEFAEMTANGIEEGCRRESIELRSRDLDRERKAVQRFAEACNGVGVAVDQPVVSRFKRAQREELDRGIGQCFRCALHFRSVGERKRLDALQVLARDSKRLAAGSEQAAADLRLDEPCRNRRGSVQYVFAIVQDNQYAPVLQVLHYGRDQVCRMAANA